MHLPFLLILIVGAALWLYALVDLINATEMDAVGRLILAALLIFVAPLGVLVWIGVRGGRPGMFTAVGLGVVVLVLAFAAVSTAVVHVSGAQVVQVASPR